MKAHRIIRTIVILVILSTNIGCDQISKGIVRQTISYHEQIGLLNNHITLTKVENTGAFLSLGDALPLPVRVILLMILPLLALSAGIIYLLTKRKLHNTAMVGISFIVGGGIGNIYDRIIYGSVTDFLHIDFVLFQTGVFNMADVSVMTGAVILVVHTYFKSEKMRDIPA